MLPAGMPRKHPAEPDVTARRADRLPDGHVNGRVRRAAQRHADANDFGVIQENRTGFPDASTRVGREHLAATGIPVPPAAMHPAGRELDQDYQSAAHYAAQRTSVGAAPITSKTIRTTNSK